MYVHAALQYKEAADSLTRKRTKRGYQATKLQTIQNEEGKINRQELLKGSKNKQTNLERILFVSKYGRQSKKIEYIIIKYFIYITPKWLPV